MRVDFSKDVQQALEVLKSGGVILYPTDTLWGLGCDASNAEAVQNIFDIKKRVDSKSMLVLLDNDNKLQRYIKDVPEVAWDLLDHVDTPMTIIYPTAYNVAKSLIADDGSLGIRVTKDAFCQRLIQRLNRPLVSTSANISGAPSPLLFDEIDVEIINAVDYVVEYRQEDTSKAKASSLMKLGVGGEISILRK